jgi:hypothetical protein
MMDCVKVLSPGSFSPLNMCSYLHRDVKFLVFVESCRQTQLRRRSVGQIESDEDCLLCA